MTISSRSALVATIATVAAASPGAALAMPVDGGRSAVSAVQDLRSADARAAADQLRRHEGASQIRAIAAGMPTWPKHPAVIASSVRPLPDSGDGGEPWVAIGAGLAGAGLLAGGLAFVERRRTPRHRVAV